MVTRGPCRDMPPALPREKQLVCIRANFTRRSRMCSMILIDPGNNSALTGMPDIPMPGRRFPAPPASAFYWLGGDQVWAHPMLWQLTWPLNVLEVHY